MPPNRALHLLSILELMFLFPSASSSTQLNTSRNTNSSCNLDLLAPFTYSETAIDGFQVKCKQGKLFLQIFSDSNITYELKGINVSEGYVTISSGATYINCPNESLSAGSGWGDLQLTPYSISTRNKFTILGCNTAVTIWNQTANNTLTEISSCITYCNSKALLSIVDGSCSSIGCCQSDIPTTNKNGFFITFGKITARGTENFTNYNGCSQAFFVDQSFRFNRSILDYTYYGNKIYNDVVLEWNIGSMTCKEAKNYATAYACKSNSDCYDMPSGVAYRCNYSKGYTGNPYQNGGCEDINECDDRSLNPCVELCHNVPGSVTCSCPKGKRGDGRKQGSGCQRVNRLELALGVGFGTTSVLVLGSLVSYWFMKKRERLKLQTNFFRQNGGFLLQQQISSQSNEAMKIFSMKELQKVTGNFNESHILGRGGYGTVYKGVFPDHRVVAIKKSRLMDESQIEQFINEIVILSQINHRNVVRLLGCCLETQVPLLVYEFISNGTLFELIHGKEYVFTLSWDARLRIAAKTAGALAYLHSAALVPIIHRDVKSANIMLDQSYTAKVSDFGASRSVPFDQTHVTKLVQGTLGYLDPEYFHTSQLTEKSDVYSFGVVLVELITGEMPVSFARSEIPRNLASHFKVLVDGNQLIGAMKPQVLVEAGIEHILNVSQIATKCLSVKGVERPTMKEVAMELEALRRFRKQQMIEQHKHDELECLLGGGSGNANSNSENSKTSRQFDFENQMILSADFPR